MNVCVVDSRLGGSLRGDAAAPPYGTRPPHSVTGPYPRPHPRSTEIAGVLRCRCRTRTGRPTYGCPRGPGGSDLRPQTAVEPALRRGVFELLERPPLKPLSGADPADLPAGSEWLTLTPRCSFRLVPVCTHAVEAFPRMTPIAARASVSPSNPRGESGPSTAGRGSQRTM